MNFLCQWGPFSRTVSLRSRNSTLKNTQTILSILLNCVCQYFACDKLTKYKKYSFLCSVFLLTVSILYCYLYLVCSTRGSVAFVFCSKVIQETNSEMVCVCILSIKLDNYHFQQSPQNTPLEFLFSKTNNVYCQRKGAYIYSSLFESLNHLAHHHLQGLSVLLNCTLCSHGNVFSQK